ncbi:MAG: lamin tail domain-containing protein [Candidatus Eisenbacteria bacterium]|nr:lamin tail domain-containing protein [Candidatus Eisenbacteria bacterium]
MLQIATLLVFLIARLVISELFVKPLTGGSEWIEIQNAGDASAPVAGLSIEDARRRPAQIPDTIDDLAPGEFLVFASNVERVHSAFAGLDSSRVVKPIGTWPTLNDADGEAGWADAVVLRSANGTVLDSLIYQARWLGGAGRSLERIDPVGGSLLAANWSPCDDPLGATPLGRNSLSPRPEEIDKGELIVPIGPIVPGSSGARISWHLDRPALLTLEIFDLDGRSVRLLRPLDEASTVGRVVWDGADDAGRRCPPGLYVVLLEGRFDDEVTPRRWRRPVVMGGVR